MDIDKNKLKTLKKLKTMWKKFSTPSSFWKPLQEGDSLEGYYKSRATNQGTRQNSTIHTFKTPTGEVSVWGSATLDRYLSSIPFGTKTKIVYQGKTTTAKGTTLKLWEVYIDNEDVDNFAVSSDLNHTEENDEFNLTI